MGIKRFEVYWTDLEPTQGSEVNKVRPCLVVSPNEMNNKIRTVIIAPFTSSFKGYPTRILSEFAGRKGEIAIDKIRTIDKSRLQKKIGELDLETSKKVSDVLVNTFSWF